MKKITAFCFLVVVFSINIFGQQYIVKFNISDKNEISKLPNFVSVDNVKGNEVIAYLYGEKNFETFKNLGYNFTLLPHPAEGKYIDMATTLAQMANWDRYPTYEVYIQMMTKFATDYPTICRLDTIGYSVNGRLLLAVEISDNVGTEENEPQFFYTSSMHGDETAGFVLLLRLADYLLSNYGTNAEVTDIVNNVRLFINPAANPDGTYKGGNSTVLQAQRYNINGYDLNRKFPKIPSSNTNPSSTIAEVQAMIDYAKTHHFVMSANFHGGAEVVNYPWDIWQSVQNLHADDTWFYAVSKRYVDTARKVFSNYMTDTYSSGVTEGGDWYVVEGSRQDFMNYYHNCREITIELSSTKLLECEYLNTYWNYNKNSLLHYIKETLYGIRGTVTNSQGQPLNAKIEILNHDKDNSWVTTNPVIGNYYRPIYPGTYQVKYSAEGYYSQTFSITINNWNSTVTKDVVLDALPQYTISGYVIDAKTGSPLQNVSISIENSSLPAVYTDNNGFYTLTYYQGTYNIIASKTNYLTTTKNVNFEANSNVDFALLQTEIYSFETNIPSEFTMSENQAWYRDNSQHYDGNWSLRSGAIDNNQSSTVTLTKTTTAGTFSFYKKVSTEYGYDKLQFYIDNVEQGSGWSGEIDWSKQSYTVTAGTHTFKWTYKKDYSQTGGADACWIDLIELPVQAPAQYTVSFHVLYGTDNVTDATVQLLGYGSKTTNSSGIASFTNVYQTTGQLSYIVYSATYGQKTGSVQVSGTTNIDVQLKPVSVNEIQSDFLIYPNPVFQNYINFVSSSKGIATINDISGKLLMEIKVEQENQTIDISQLQKGMYLILFTNDNGKIVQKLIKQ